MAKAWTKIEKIEFDFTDEQVTKVTVHSDYGGDVPINVVRRYEKVFPARIRAIEIFTMNGGIQDYLLWPFQA